MSHIIPDSPPGVTAALAVLAAVALAALVLALLEHRRGTATRSDLEGQSRTVDMLMMALDRHERRLKAHATIHTAIIDALEYDHPGAALPAVDQDRSAFELIEGGCPDTPAGLEPVAAPPRRVALSVVAR